MSDHSFPWLSLLVLGAAHGINPAMGWLFAVGRGLQRRDRREVWRALGPLAAGHALAIAVAVVTAIALGEVLPGRWLRWLVAAALVGVGADGLLRHRHISLGGMRVGARELATWSFLVATVHGAGLMVLPFVLGARTTAPAMIHQHHDASMALTGTVAFDPLGITAPLMHTLGYLLVTAAIAVVVYEKVGLRILRRAWINVHVLWAASLIAAGVLTALL
ncbi:MAG TPA: hypothetical protein VJW73_22550 [Gemmatimonadaceae bacterium]|nr:hypothetical protein [Gemmatimonadaceae bacterium]